MSKADITSVCSCVWGGLSNFSEFGEACYFKSCLVPSHPFIHIAAPTFLSLFHLVPGLLSLCPFSVDSCSLKHGTELEQPNY